jgi:hypothetical protein
VSYSANGTNASKTTTANFSAPGNYTFTVIITDGSLTATSSVAVTVVAPNQAPTVAQAAAASPNPVTAMKTTVTVLGADDGGEAILRYTWSSTGPATVTFSPNGTNAAKTATATFTVAGTYTLTVTISDLGGLSVTSSVNVTVTAANQPPTVAKAAVATPNPVTGKTTALSVLGADDGGAANLRYTWFSSGPAPVTISANGTNAAQNVTATFAQAGSYTFTVTIADVGGLTITSSVKVTVQQKLTTIVVSPGTATVAVRQTLQFSAQAFDQFGVLLVTQPTFRWSLSGHGSVSSTGLYTAPRSTGGPYTVSASASGVKGSAKVTIVSSVPAALSALGEIGKARIV